MSDAEEFLEEAGKYVEPDKRKRRLLKQEDSVAPVYNNDNGENMPIGKLIQYAYNGEGYTPTSKTAKKLPSGIYSIDMVNHLLTFVPRNLKTDNLMRLPDSKSDTVINRIKKFWTLKDEYKNGNEFAVGGYLHKMGIMLWGPPGSGKTCTIKFIMEDIIQRNGIVIYGDTNPDLISEALHAFSSIELDRPVVVVFEDFDELINRFSEKSYLSILDGEGSIDNALFIATTNYPSKLDPRMYNRPGRFSDVVKIPMPSVDARRMYLTNKLKKSDEVEKIVALTEGFSIDHLKAVVQGVYFEGRGLDEEIKRLRTLFKAPKDDQGNDNKMGIG